MDSGLPSVISKVRSVSEEVVAAKIRIRSFYTEPKLANLAKMIFNEAIKDLDSLKVAQLSKLLVDLNFKDSKNGTLVTFKDALVKHVLVKLETFANKANNEFQFSKDFFMTFLGNLYNTDVISSHMIENWVNLLSARPTDRETVLRCIQDKVIEEFIKPDHDSKIDSLRAILISRKEHATPTTSDHQLTKTSTPDLPKKTPVPQAKKKFSAQEMMAMSRQARSDQPAAFLPFNDDPDNKEFNRRSDSDFDYDANARVMQRLTSPKSVTDRFKEFLTNLKEIPGPEADFRFLDVSQSTNSERIECANFMIDMIISTTTKINIEVSANVYEAVVQYPVLDTSVVSFPSHVTKLCVTKLNALYRALDLDWPKIENLGRFFGYLYNQSPMGTSNVKLWFTKVNACGDDLLDEAIDSYFFVMQMVAETLKERDEAFFRSQLCLFLDTPLEEEMFVQFNQWLIELDRGEDNGSFFSSDSDSASSDEHSEMVAFTKRLNSCKASKPKTMPDEFKQYLMALKTDPSKRFDLERFRDCTESDRKECAHAMMEGVLLNSSIMVQCANDARIIQCSHSPSNSRHTNFMAHFSVYCENEMDAMFDDEPLDWTCIEDLGMFLGQLYIREVVKNATINKWFEHVQKFVAERYYKAIGALLEVLKIVFDRMKSRDNKNFKGYILQLRIHRNNGQIPRKYAQWTREILDEHVLNAAPQRSQTNNGQIPSEHPQRTLEILSKLVLNTAPQRGRTQSPTPAPTQTTGAIRKTQTASSSLSHVAITAAQLHAKNHSAPESENFKENLEKLKVHLERLTPDNGQEILLEISLLKLFSSSENVRRITNAIVSRVKNCPELVQSISEILKTFPVQSVSEIDQHVFKNQLVATLWSQVTYLQQFSKLTGSLVNYAVVLFDLIKELYIHSVVNKTFVVEVFETLAIDSRNNEATSLKLHLTIINAFGTDKLRNLKLPETKNTLKRHLNNSNSKSIRMNCEAALRLMEQANRAVQMKQTVAASLPSTSKELQPTNSAVAGTSKDGVQPLTVQASAIPCFRSEDVASPSISSCSKSFLAWERIDDLKHLVAAIKTRDQLVQFAKAFYETAMKSENLLHFVKSAELIENEFDLRRTGKSFQEVFMDIFYKSYNPMSADQMKESKIALNRVKLTAELYKIDWINIDKVIAGLDKLCANPSLVLLFHVLLQTISMTLIKNGHGHKLVKYRVIYDKRRGSYIHSAAQFTSCLEILSILNDIERFSVTEAAAPVANCSIETSLEDLTADNVEAKAAEIVNNFKGTNEELDTIIEQTTAKAICDPKCSEIVASLYKQLLAMFKGSAKTFKAKLSHKFQIMMLSTFDHIVTPNELPTALNMLTFFADLYSLNIITSDFIILCSDLIWVHEHDRNLLTDFFFRKVGQKLERDNFELIEKIFNKFEVQEKRSRCLEDLIKFRKNDWQVEVGNPSTCNGHSDVNLMLNELAKENLGTVAAKCTVGNFKMRVCELWDAVIENPQKSKLYADLCQRIKDDAFRKRLNELFHCRLVKFASLRKHELDDLDRDKLATVMVFTADLHVRGIIKDEIFEQILKVSKHLNFDSLAKISSIVSEQISQSDNKILQGSLAHFEKTLHEDSMETCQQLKEDIVEIKEIVLTLQAKK